jgi:hypothetical protein
MHKGHTHLHLALCTYVKFPMIKMQHILYVTIHITHGVIKISHTIIDIDTM